MKWLIGILFILVFILGSINGYNFRGYYEKPQIATVVEYKERIVYPPYTKSSNSKTITIDEALAIVAEGNYSHIWWANHPELQDKNTGDTEFNLMWAKRYQDIGDLIKELANESKGR